jgi:hypothetical protein
MAYGFDRFLTTHTGSLPRPDDLIRAMFAKEEGVPVDPGRQTLSRLPGRPDRGEAFGDRRLKV